MDESIIALLHPEISLGEISTTLNNHLILRDQAIKKGAKLLVYPLNSLTGSLSSLANQGDIKEQSKTAVNQLTAISAYSLLAYETDHGIVVTLYKNGRPVAVNRARKVSDHEGIVILHFYHDGTIYLRHFRHDLFQGNYRSLCIHFVGTSSYVGQKEELENAHGERNYCFLTSSKGETTMDGVSFGESYSYIDGVEHYSKEPLFCFSYPLTACKKSEKLRKNPSIYPNFKEDTLVPMFPFLAHMGSYDQINLEDVKEALKIQSEALALRMETIGVRKAVLGLSGGLDSALALIVAYEAFLSRSWDLSGLYVYTLPAFGTSLKTRENVDLLADALGVHVEEISLKDTLMSHFKDIHHDSLNTNVAYENAQARERTQVLMDIANDVGGIMVGTGDMSELALGWTTYNGDHMSMYAVNGGVPKTMVRYLTLGYGKLHPNVGKAIQSIIDTPVSPELLPVDDLGNISQKTEGKLGPYEVHDFYLYGWIEGAPLSLIYKKACDTFKNMYQPSELKEWLRVFTKRFLSQAFKRNCMPEGPQVTKYSLSSRPGGYHFPSDVSSKALLSIVEEL